MKRFLEWIRVKQALDQILTSPPFVAEREIWWAGVGENIGREINGKSDRFSRPVLIFKKLSRDFYFVIPMTSQAQTSTWFVPVTFRGKNMYACLHQARSIDYRRLFSRMGQLEEHDAEKIAKAFGELYL